jgi:hypothetical protein
MRNAIVTASYAPDFERCRILCDTIDRHVTGYDCHYLLIDEPDRPLFEQLTGPERKIVTDRELLPWWLWRLPAPLSPGGKRLWLSPLTLPLHGWHVQQLKRIAIAHHIDADGLIYCDSDTAVVKSFDVQSVWRGGDIRLYCQDGGALTARNDHLAWAAHAARAFGIPEDRRSDDDYVCTFLTWKRQTVVDMCRHIEDTHRRPWISVIGRSRKFSECMLYGAYVDGVLGGAGHFRDGVTLCPMQWFDPAPSFEEITDLVASLESAQVAVGIQSFIPISADDFRKAVESDGYNADNDQIRMAGRRIAV